MRQEYKIFIHDVSFCYGSSVALDSVTLTLSTDERVGLIGPNGAGKSTLLKILAGQLHPTRGSASMRPAEGAGSAIPLSADDPWVKAVLPFFRPDSVFLSEQVNKMINAAGNETEVLDFLVDVYSLATGVPFSKSDAWDTFVDLKRQFRIDASDGSKSQGERAAFDYAFRLSLVPCYKMLFLDEPLNGLDPAKRRALQAFIANRGIGCVLATVDPQDCLTFFVKRVLLVRDARVVLDEKVADIRNNWEILTIRLSTDLQPSDVRQRICDLPVVGFLSESRLDEYVVVASTRDASVHEEIICRMEGARAKTIFQKEHLVSCLEYLSDVRMELRNA